METGRRGVFDIVEAVVDASSFRLWDLGEPSDDCSDGALIAGAGRLRGRAVAVVASDFEFMAGSLGVRSADLLVRAIERATEAGLPVVALPCSSGTRMQEGTSAFVQMIRICGSIAQHKDAGLPYLVYLRHPTIGGAMASWGTLGHLTFAEPGALLGLVGPRVHEVLLRRPPDYVQTAENRLAHGLIDGVVPLDKLAEILASVLSIAAGEDGPGVDVVDTIDAIAEVDAWESVTRCRRADRPGLWELLDLAASDLVPLGGSGEGEVDSSVLAALGRFGGVPCVIVGQPESTGQRRAVGSGGATHRPPCDEAGGSISAAAAERHRHARGITVGRGRTGRVARRGRPLPYRAVDAPDAHNLAAPWRGSWRGCACPTTDRQGDRGTACLPRSAAPGGSERHYEPRFGPRRSLGTPPGSQGP